MTSRSSATILTNRSTSSACSLTSSDNFCSCPSRRSRRHASSLTVSPDFFAGRMDGLAARRGSAATTTSLFMRSPFSLRPLSAHWPLVLSAGEAKSMFPLPFYLRVVLLKFGSHDEYIHDGPGRRKRRAPVSAHRPARQARRSVRREIPHYRFYAQQLLELRPPKGRRPHSIQIPLARPSHPHRLAYLKRRTR